MVLKEKLKETILKETQLSKCFGKESNIRHVNLITHLFAYMNFLYQLNAIAFFQKTKSCHE